MGKTFVLLSLLLLPGLLAAQALPAIRNVEVHKTGDTVAVMFEISEIGMRSDAKITYIPVLTGGGNRLEMEPLTLSRRRRAISDSRAGEQVGMRVIVGRRQQAPVHYRAAVPYRDWMRKVSLDVRCVISGCGMSVALPEAELAGDLLLYYAVIPHYDRRERACALTPTQRYASGHPILYPAGEYGARLAVLARDRSESGGAVRFGLSSSHIDRGPAANAELLDLAVRTIRVVCEDPGAKLKKIFIAGYASPEGALAFNTALARKRALAIRDYLARTTGLAADTVLFEIYDGGEDWDGLRRRIAASDLAEKDELLRIVASDMSDAPRKAALKKLGTTYRRMLHELYPPLRQAGYIQIYYDLVPNGGMPGAVAGVSDGVADGVVDGAADGGAGGPGGNGNAGVEHYNRALALMNEGRWSRARDCLLSLGDDPAALNSLGVCYMMTGDYDTADTCFIRAAAAGDPDAARNLEETQTVRRIR